MEEKTTPSIIFRAAGVSFVWVAAYMEATHVKRGTRLTVRLVASLPVTITHGSTNLADVQPMLVPLTSTTSTLPAKAA